MSAIAAGSMFMWMAGVLVGVGLSGEVINPTVATGGALLTVMGVFYIRRFAEK